MLRNCYQSYDNMSKETMSGRELEAYVLTKAANKFKGCLPDLENQQHEGKLEEALVYNQKIWNVLQEELVNENNPLPAQIRQNLLNLSLFVDRHTLTTMAFPDSSKVQMLVDINLNLASGLRGNLSK
jgi:flagellar biosynthesis activator protein FlaF